MPGVVQQQHHHRSTTKTAQKAYKPRFTSKNALRDQSKGRVEHIEKGSRKTAHQQVMNKFDRRNQAKQKRLASHKDHERVTSVFTGRDGAPRIVAVVPLCESIDTGAVITDLNGCLDLEYPSLFESGYIPVDRFKQKLQYITPQRDLLSILDACSIADYVLLVLSADEEANDFGELVLRSIEGQGISNVYTAVQYLDKVEPPKRRLQTLTSLKSYISHFFPNQEKVFSLDSRQECQNVVRSLCTTTPRGISWREDRSWMFVEKTQWVPGISHPIDAQNMVERGSVILTGVVRGQNLKADRLVHVGDWGDFQISKITAAPRPKQPRKSKENALTIDSTEDDEQVDQPSADQDTLDELAPEEVVMNDANADDAMTTRSLALTERRSVLLDDEQYYSGEENENVAGLPKRLPRGTSKYQAAWYLGDNSDSGSDMEDEEDDAMEEDLPMDDGSVAPPLTEAGASTMAGTEMDATSMASSQDQEDHDDDLVEYRSKKSTLSAAESNRQFPDEIELPPTVSARERLLRYRGLKSAKTSPWDTSEDKPHEPTDWSRLLDIADYRAAKSKVQRDSLVGGVKAGTRVNVHIRDVPVSPWQSSLAGDVNNDNHDSSNDQSTTKPLRLFSLLRHEHKHTAIHSTLTLSSSFPRPLKNKEELIAQVGMRRFVVNPVFTAVGATPNNVHKVERWLWPGTTAVASWVGPVTWGAVPVLWFTRSGESLQEPGKDDDKDIAMTADPTTADSPQPLQLLGTGTLLPPTRSRIHAKRAVLTGQPAAIHRNLTTIRYMFFSPEDVAYFRSLPLWTNRGRRGQIKESLGTHGRFKAVFEGGKKGLNVQEAVCVSLWKRVWPMRCRGLLDNEDEGARHE